MANINLATENSNQDKVSTTTSGIIALLVVFLLVLALYGLLYLGKWQTDKDIAKTEGDYQTQSALLTSDKAVQVIDFHNRLEIAKNLLSKSRDNREILGEVEKAVMPGVYLDSYTFNDSQNSVVLNCVADSYNTLAKQILSFKKSTYFASVSTGKGAFNAATGKISYEISLQLK